MQLSPGIHIRQKPVSLDVPPYDDVEVAHVLRLVRSYRILCGRDLVPYDPNPYELVRAVREAPFALVSHDMEPGTPFTFANDVAQRICGLTWDRVDLRHTRGSADVGDLRGWTGALDLSVARGWADGVGGVRRSRDGRYVSFRNARLWSLLDDDGRTSGQALVVPQWHWVARV